jgi:hypothetical protein
VDEQGEAGEELVPRDDGLAAVGRICVARGAPELVGVGDDPVELLAGTGVGHVRVGG